MALAPSGQRAGYRSAHGPSNRDSANCRRPHIASTPWAIARTRTKTCGMPSPRRTHGAGCFAAWASRRRLPSALAVGTRVTRIGWDWTTATSPASAAGPPTSWPRPWPPRELEPGRGRAGPVGGSSSSRSRVTHCGSASTPSTSAQSTQVPTRSPADGFDLEHLPRAGGLIAAAWLTLCGYEVSWPLEPCRYDLIAARGRPGAARPGQDHSVPTRQGSWSGQPVNRRSAAADAYDPDDIDYFFIIDGDLDYYLIPVTVVGGLSTINLSAYQQFRLAQQPTRFSRPEPSRARPAATRCRRRRTPRPGSA